MEFVYVVKRPELFAESFRPVPSVRWGDGPLDFCMPLNENNITYWNKRIQSGFFMEREAAERDSSFKQVIPYTIVMDGTKILVLKRLPAGNEPRLHEKLSIGIGGHINPDDLDHGANDFVYTAALRELHEELYLPNDPLPRLIGLVNNETDSVGAVHVGLVFIVQTSSQYVAIREKDQLDGRFMPLEAMLEHENFETWSKMIIERLGDILKGGSDA